MTPKVNKTDSTRNQRQARRRAREKQWLKASGWRSWEALHTALMCGAVHLTPGKPDDQPTLVDQQFSDKNLDT
jgi:hypothetical protein